MLLPYSCYAHHSAAKAEAEPMPSPLVFIVYIVFMLCDAAPPLHTEQPTEVYYTCAWSYEPVTLEPYLAFAGRQGIIRIVKYAAAAQGFLRPACRVHAPLGCVRVVPAACWRAVAGAASLPVAARGCRCH